MNNMEKKQKEVTANPIKDLCISFFYWWYNTRGTNTEQGFDSWAQTEEGQQKIAALQSSQNFEKFSLYRETPTVATDHTVMEPSPTQEVENPDFEAYIKKLVYAFHSVGAFGFAPNSEYQWEALWRKYRRDGILPQYNTHESNWKERLPLDEIIAALQSSPAQEVEKPDFEMLLKLSRLIQEQYEGLNEKQSDDIAAHIYNEAAVPLLKENQSLKDRVKELEQEAFFIKLHRDSAQEDASSLRAIIKSLEAENEELRKVLKELIPMAEDGYTLHKKNCSHQEFLSEDRELLQKAESLLKPLPPKPEN